MVHFLFVGDMFAKNDEVNVALNSLVSTCICPPPQITDYSPNLTVSAETFGGSSL